MTDVAGLSFKSCHDGRDAGEVQVSILHYRDRLFRQVTLYDLAVDGPTFQAELAERRFTATQMKQRLPWGLRMSVAFDNWIFPTSDVRNGEEEEQDPIRVPSYAELLAKLDWSAQPPDWSDVDSRSAEAAAHLAQAVVLVDGKVWVENPEPVWSRVHRCSRHELSVAPTREDACDNYRLDDPPDKDSMDLFGRRTEVMLFRADLLQRDDVRELARAAASLWPRFGRRLHCAGDGAEAVRLEVDGIVARGGTLSKGDCVAVLDAYVFGRTMLAKHGRRFRDRGRSVSDRAGAIATRWKKERAGYIARTADAEFSIEDLEAIACLEN